MQPCAAGVAHSIRGERCAGGLLKEGMKLELDASKYVLQVSCMPQAGLQILMLPCPYALTQVPIYALNQHLVAVTLQAVE